jgi:antitoxin ParD1/3/4
MNISLPDELRQFVENEVTRGGYSTASEFFRELIRERQKKRADEKLEALLVEGLEIGDAAPLTEADWSDIRREVRERAERRGRTVAAE